MKRTISALLLCLAVPAVVIGGAWLFGAKAHAWLALCVALLACVAVFLRFERRHANAGRLLVIAVMVALAVASRQLFHLLPLPGGFNPVAAITIITGMVFGGEAGFMTGAMTALVSNFFLTQGAWTPFQMLAWGLVGLLGGALTNLLQRSLFWVALYGALSALLFSLMLDIWSVLYADGVFNLTRYLAFVASSAPATGIYAVANVLFLLAFQRPVCAVLFRLKQKYRL